LWLLLIPVAGLASLRGSSQALTLALLTALPGTAAFVGVWLAGLELNAAGLLAGVIPVGLAVLVCAIAGLRLIQVPRSLGLNASAIWAAALLVIAAFPILAINPLVIPAASTVRLVPRGTVSASPLGLTSAFGIWPALVVSLVALIGLGLVGWLTGPQRTLMSLPGPARYGFTLPARRGRALPRFPGWTQYVPWIGLVIVIGIASLRQ
jgi:hypothetical protein